MAQSTENEDLDFEKELDSYIESEEISRKEAQVIVWAVNLRLSSIFDCQSVLYVSYLPYVLSSFLLWNFKLQRI